MAYVRYSNFPSDFINTSQYSIMRNLGNRVCLHSPSRGFSMELGNIVSVVIAARLDLPISTTQGIVGSTVGVALCDGGIKSVNWRLVLWMYGDSGIKCGEYRAIIFIKY